MFKILSFILFSLFLFSCSDNNKKGLDCLDDSDCQSNSICEKETCVVKTSLDSCSIEIGCIYGLYCDYDVSKCRDNTCESNKDCNGSSICNDSNVCEKVQACVESSDCKSSAKPVCSEEKICVALKENCDPLCSEGEFCMKGDLPGEFTCASPEVCGDTLCSSAGNCRKNAELIECVCYTGYDDSSYNCSECAPKYSWDDTNKECVKTYNFLCDNFDCNGRGTCVVKDKEASCECNEADTYTGVNCFECAQGYGKLDPLDTECYPEEILCPDQETRCSESGELEICNFLVGWESIHSCGANHQYCGLDDYNVYNCLCDEGYFGFGENCDNCYAGYEEDDMDPETAIICISSNCVSNDECGGARPTCSNGQCI